MKIAFVNTDMNVGGIPKASIPLLKELVKNHEVTLILTNGEGEIVNQIPENVRIQVLSSHNYATQLKDALKQGRICTMLRSILAYKKASDWIVELHARIMLRRKIPEHYDLAIAYFGMNAKCVLVTLEQVDATKRVAFMHGDHPFKTSELSSMEQIYRRFDRLFCVSNATRLKYMKDFPSCKNLFDVFYNIMDVAAIKAKATERLPTATFDGRAKLHIVTVGRLSPEKGQMMIPEIAEMLDNAGIGFVWHIVGTGNDYDNLQQVIEQKNISDMIILHGNALNPYPYIKAADIYVQPSYTEGYCLTIREAAILGKPIVATKVGGMWEHFCDGKDILLCKATPESIFDKLMLLITDGGLKARLGANAAKHDWSNVTEIKKLGRL